MIFEFTDKKGGRGKILPMQAHELDGLFPIYQTAVRTIGELGIDQWQNGYPTREILLADIAKEELFRIEVDGQTAGGFALLLHRDPTYDVIRGAWRTGDHGAYAAVHRVAVDPEFRGRDLPLWLYGFCEKMARERGLSSLRIDTHEGNVVMRRSLEKCGFRHVGEISLPDGSPRVAYEKVFA